MKKLKQFLTAALVVATSYVGWACATDAAASSAPPLKAPTLVAASAIGDTLQYRLSWTAVTRATGYRATVIPCVAGSNPTTACTVQPGWTGLPSATAVTAASISFTAINLTAYDCVAFRAILKSVRGTTVSRDSSMTQWTYCAPVGAPGPITVDSSLVPVAVTITPKALNTLAGMTTQYCNSVTFADGRRGMRTSDPQACQAAFVLATPAALRVSAEQQNLVDGLCLAYAGGTTADAGYSIGAGGSLNPTTGLYTAGTTAGRYRVIVSTVPGCVQSAAPKPASFFARSRISDVVPLG